MKYFIFVLIVAWSECASIPEQIQADGQHFLDILMNRCRKMPSLSAIKKCGIHMESFKDIEDYHKFQCESDGSYECAIEATKFILPCLSQEEEYITEFILYGYNSSKQELCSRGPEYYTDLVNNLSTTNCIKNNEFSRLGQNCAYNLFKKEELNKLVLTKLYLCSKLSELKECILPTTEATCNNKVLDDILVKAFQPYLNWCELNNQ